MKFMRLLAVWLPGMAIAVAISAEPAPRQLMPVAGAAFETVLPIAPGQTKATVQAFGLDKFPVTNADFARFVKANPQWRRDRITKLFADDKYLAHWRDPSSAGESMARQPVTQVSWYAARAYCKSRNARLPTWHEWEWAAAASATSTDARQDPQWRKQMLDWYARPTAVLPAVGLTKANLYGIHDLHGVIWEWVEDFNGMLVSADSRAQGDPDETRFCGSGALTMEQKDQYAILMRIAMLSSLQAKYTTTGLGFRCAGPIADAGPSK